MDAPYNTTGILTSTPTGAAAAAAAASRSDSTNRIDITARNTHNNVCTRQTSENDDLDHHQQQEQQRTGMDYKDQCYGATIESSPLNMHPSTALVQSSTTTTSNERSTALDSVHRHVPSTTLLFASCTAIQSSDLQSQEHNNNSTIPLVHGVAIPDDNHDDPIADVIVPQIPLGLEQVRRSILPNDNNSNDIENTFHDETEALERRQTGQQVQEDPIVSVPNIISIQSDRNNQSSRNKERRMSSSLTSSSLSISEKRYFIKLVVIAIIVNTCIVLVGVIGGVCGLSGCHLPRHRHETTVDVGDNTNNTGPGDSNVTTTTTTISPTPAPSRRLASSISSDVPVVAIISIVPSPTMLPMHLDEAFSAQPTLFVNTSAGVDGGNDGKENIDKGESLLYPTISPTITGVTKPIPTTANPIDGVKDSDEVAEREMGVNIVLLIPIAIIVDFVLITICLCLFYYKYHTNKIPQGGGKTIP